MTVCLAWAGSGGADVPDDETVRVGVTCAAIAPALSWRENFTRGLTALTVPLAPARQVTWQRAVAHRHDTRP